MATKTKAAQKEKKDEAPEKETPEATTDAPLPLLDLSDAAVKKMIKLAKKRGYVTYEQINAVLPSEEVTSEQIEDILAMLNEMGINTVEQEETESDEEEKPAEEADEEESDGELVESPAKAVAETKKSEPGERTDDPVRMYLREMGSVELLSREGEIAIAKRIEAGREAMIAGLCESPLTFQAIIIWRDELDRDLALAREQLHPAHFAQIHAHRIVGALGRLLGLNLGGGPSAGLRPARCPRARAPPRPPRVPSPRRRLLLQSRRHSRPFR